MNEYKTLYGMPLKLQMQNVGAEVNRAVRFKDSGKIERSKNRAEEALRMLDIVRNDPKNHGREIEFDFLIEELKDFMDGCKKYDIDSKRMCDQYDVFRSSTD